MKEKLLFNPEGVDTLETRQLIGGNTTNIFNLNNVRFKWANRIYRTMVENFWIPEKVDLSADNLDALSEDERRAYVGILSFLIFLDSIQTNNLPNISNYITAPEVNLALAVQTYQEAIHSQSYQYIIETLVPVAERNDVYDYWRTDKLLLDRISYIASIYQDFMDKSSDKNFKRVVVANYLLEGVYFYNGFTFFYNLASRGKMPGTSEVIRYINRDELTHVVLFQYLIKELGISKKLVHTMMNRAVEQEIEWSNHILGNNILGISTESTEGYTRYLANRRLRHIGMQPLYPEFDTNPYKHLEKIADTVADASVKANFFESTNTAYNQSSAIGGWDDF